MSNDKPPTQPKPIRIKTVRFNDSQDIPGATNGGMTSSATGRSADDAQTNVGRLDITYEPWLRRFKIAQFEASKTAPTKIVCIPEAAVKQYEEW